MENLNPQKELATNEPMKTDMKENIGDQPTEVVTGTESGWKTNQPAEMDHYNSINTNIDGLINSYNRFEINKTDFVESLNKIRNQAMADTAFEGYENLREKVVQRVANILGNVNVISVSVSNSK